MTDLDAVVARLRNAALTVEHRKPGCPCGTACATPIACLIQMEGVARRLETAAAADHPER